jgi:protein SCO1/2
MRRNGDAEGVISRRALLGAGLLLALPLLWPPAAPAHRPGKDERLPRIGPAPEFTLTAQDGRRVSLSDLRGKVVVVTFIYASCTDTCPLLTAKLVALQRRLATDANGRIFFVGITVDPERDTSEVLAQYAKGYGADPEGWAFLTGTPAEIQEVARRYGIYRRKQPRGDVDHTFLTSLVDPAGTLRVQYLGVRFDPEEMRRDLQSLLAEGRR